LIPVVKTTLLVAFYTAYFSTTGDTLNIRMNIAQIRLLQIQLDETLLAMQSLFADA